MISLGILKFLGDAREPQKPRFRIGCTIVRAKSGAELRTRKKFLICGIIKGDDAKTITDSASLFGNREFYLAESASPLSRCTLPSILVVSTLIDDPIFLIRVLPFLFCPFPFSSPFSFPYPFPFLFLFLSLPMSFHFHLSVILA